MPASEVGNGKGTMARKARIELPGAVYHVMARKRLRDLPKGAMENQALASWLGTRTTVWRSWIAECLGMGMPRA